MNQDENAPQAAQDGAGIDLLAGRRDKRNPDGTWAEGNLGAFKTGERSRGLLDVPALAEAHRARVEAITADLGGVSRLSAVQRPLVGELGRLQIITDSLGADVLARGTLTSKGRARAAVGLYLSVLDRQQKLALVLGLQKREKPVAGIEDYLSGGDDGS